MRVRAAGVAAFRAAGVSALLAGASLSAHIPPGGALDVGVADLDAQQAARPTLGEVLAETTADDWRRLDPENTLYLDLDVGTVVIELAPDFSPRHVGNIRTLVRAGAFDGGAVVRSQDNYVAQWSTAAGLADGDPPPAEPGGAAAALAAEFEAPAGSLPFTPVPDGDVYAPEAGFTRGFPAGRDPETGATWIAHCYGAVGVARGADRDSGNGSSLYAVTGHAPRHLDRNLTMAGRVISGIELLSVLPRGTGPLGFYEAPAAPVPIRRASLGADMPAGERIDLEILRTDSEAFRRVIEARRYRSEEFFVFPVGRVELCNVPVPTRPVGE